jgi:uncharacterized protein YlxW (UPF0749 family)
MDANKGNIENIEFITFIRSARRRSSTAAQLRHENAGLLQIIADFDARLATVEAERDELQRKLNGYHCTARNTRIVDIRELDLAAHKVIL